jgi:RHS repeat-associated protein
MYVEAMVTARTILFLLAALLLGGAGVVDASYTNPPLAAEAPSPKKALMGENRPGSNCSGEQLDPNSQFYYLRARWMKPSTGTFISVDPWAGDIQEPMTLSRYLYANATPVSFVDPSGLFTFGQVMASIAVSGILASTVHAAPADLLDRYSLILYLLDYYDHGPDGKKNTNDDVGNTSFPGDYYAAIVEKVEEAFEGETKKGKARFKLVWTAGMKSEVSSAVAKSRYSAIVSHSSSSFKAVFPSLEELKNFGLGAEHITEKELQEMSKKGMSTGLYIAACRAGTWAEGSLSAESRSNTEISSLLLTAVKKLKQASETK